MLFIQLVVLSMYVYVLMIDPRIAELIILNQGDMYLKMEYLKM